MGTPLPAHRLLRTAGKAGGRESFRSRRQVRRAAAQLLLQPGQVQQLAQRSLGAGRLARHRVRLPGGPAQDRRGRLYLAAPARPERPRRHAAAEARSGVLHRARPGLRRGQILRRAVRCVRPQGIQHAVPQRQRQPHVAEYLPGRDPLRQGGRRRDGAEWRYGGGYINKIKPRNGDDFVWMSTEAGADVHRGVYVAGLNYANRNFSHRRDQLPVARHHQYLLQRNQGHAAAGRRARIAAGRPVLQPAQHRRQPADREGVLQPPVGHQGRPRPGRADAHAGATPPPASGANMRNPWSAYPGYTDVQVESFNRARENAFLRQGGIRLHQPRRPGPDRLCAADPRQRRQGAASSTRTRWTSISSGRRRKACCAARRYGCATPTSSSGAAAIRTSTISASS